MTETQADFNEKRNEKQLRVEMASDSGSAKSLKKDNKEKKGKTLQQARQVYMNSTFHTQRQLKVFYKDIKMK